MKEDFFKTGRDYNNVYFMVVDAIGHSRIVRHNDLDKVDYVFDKFEETVYKSVEEKKNKTRCQYAEFWGWQGDGGLCIFYDKDESRARETAILSAKEILAEVPHLNVKLSRSDIFDEIHVRIALHKGGFRYKGPLKLGSIHSKELNLVSHVEKIVPSDTLAISKEVYDISGELKTEFTGVEDTFEDMEFYLYSTQPRDEVLKQWKQNISVAGEISIGIESDVPREELGLAGVFSQRALTADYVKLLNEAQTSIWVLGVGLGGFQSDLRDKLFLEKALKGVDIRFLIVDPEAYVRIKEGSFPLPSWFDYATGGGSYNRSSVRSLVKKAAEINKEIEKNASPQKTFIKVRYYSVIPTCAMLKVDSVLYFSPYFAKQQSLKCFTLKLRKGGRLYDQAIRHFMSIWDDSNYSRSS